MNLNKKMFIVLATILVFASLSPQNYSQKLMDIDGYLVDANDKPVRNGRVTVFYDPPLPTTSFEQLILSWTPLDDGLFGMEADWYRGRKIMVLMEDRPEGFYPIEDPIILTNERIFKGVVISKYARERNLGRVRDYIKYGQVAVELRKCSASFLEKIVRQQMFLKVTTQDGFVVANSTFKSAYVKESKQLIFRLPEGGWYLEFIDEFTSQTILPPLKVTISLPETFEVMDLKGC